MTVPEADEVARQRTRWFTQPPPSRARDIHVPGEDPELQRRLFADHRIEIPINDAMLMRISIAMYNTEEDVERLLDALSVSLKSNASSTAAPIPPWKAPPQTT